MTAIYKRDAPDVAVVLGRRLTKRELRQQFRRHSIEDYPPTIPSTLPPGRVLVHNNVVPARKQGARGSRFWTRPRSRIRA